MQALQGQYTKPIRTHSMPSPHPSPSSLVETVEVAYTVSVPQGEELVKESLP
jgi:hypothetical protein